ncbi:CLUMA_CG013745, isoform A [Clunio marinus]|uniref:CLUMA_CG013745, isoform A n=1 Tax=Clunio marinus TaxID=568069 RepID=A0A1J1ILP1_9DIPT|nr:CLUMA_CG013745, isoform A [Clunio marinus]
MIQVIAKKWLLICLVILGGILFASNVNSQEINANTKFQSAAAPTLSFLYCYSCGYKNAFDEYSSIILEKYPDIHITGANYDPPGLNMYISKILVVAKYLLMALIGSSFDLFGFLGMATPTFWTWATDNKLFAVMMTFFFSNMLEAQLISSGAFEIALNDIPIWSKIATGRIPAPQELFQIIESHLQFTDNLLEKNPDFVK